MTVPARGAVQPITASLTSGCIPLRAMMQNSQLPRQRCSSGFQSISL
ncbi:hypothetical protein [Dactylosporangium sp. NPDC006015]